MTATNDLNDAPFIITGDLSSRIRYTVDCGEMTLRVVKARREPPPPGGISACPEAAAKINFPP